MARRLKESTKKSIEQALQIWAGPLREGASPEHILHQCALHSIGLMELDEDVTKDWYEESE